MKYIISENLENDCVYAYAAKEFWVYDKQACRWYTSGFCREQYEQAKLQYPSLTPEDFLEDDNDYNLLDDYELPCAALDALQEAVKSGKREVALFEGTNPPTPADADASPCAPGASDVPPSPSQSAAADAQQGANDDLPEVCRGCRCAICGNKDCPTPCFQRVDDVQECKKLGPMGDDCEDYQPKEDEMQTDDHGIMTDAGELLPNGTECRRHVVSRVRIGADKIQAIHVCDDQPEGVKIWLNACEPAEYWVLSKAGEIGGEHIESCPYCAALLRIGCGDVLLMPINREPKSNKPPEPADSEGSPRPNPGDVYRSAKGGRLYKIGEHSDGKKTYYRTMRYDTHSCTWEPANGSLYPELSNAQGEFEAWIRTEQLEPVAPNGAAAASTAASAATEPSRVAETTTTSENGADANSFPNALTAPQPAEGCADIATNAPSSMPTFDYSGLDDQTVADLHLAEREIRNGRKMAEMGLQRMADGVAIAHDALCGSCDNLSQLKHGNRGENTFGAWCESLGLHRKAAYRLLQVSRLFDDSTPREQKALRELTNSVLYEASRPSAEPEAVEALKRQQVKTLKEYRELEAQIKAERQARAQAEQQLADERQAHQAERASTSALLRDEQQRRQKAEEGRIAAEKDKAAAQQRAAKAEAQGKKDAALVEKLQDIVLQRDNEVAEQKERADAAEIRAQQAENRPVEVAVQAPDPAEVQRLASEKAAKMTAMLKAQLHTLQTQLDDAENRVDAAANNAYLSAAEFAAQAAAMIDGIRASFWAMAKELPDADFNQALEPLDTAVSRIYNREWEDGWNDSWENNEEDDQ